MSMDIFLDRIATDINIDRIRQGYAKQAEPHFQTTDGTRLSIKEVQGYQPELIGVLHICYIPGKWLTLDRIVSKKSKYQKQRRILYPLDTKSGQIGAALLTSLLKIENGEPFSKHKFTREIEEEYFNKNGIIVQTSELTEVLSRMFRKTLVQFFGIKGRYFERATFVVKVTEVSDNEYKKAYLEYKSRIDKSVQDIVYELNGKSGSMGLRSL